jgi:uncharacterized phiE125 gp8 family phage protein
LTTQLTTLPNAKQWLNVDPGNLNADVLLTRLITAASAWIEAYLGRTIGINSYSQAFNGRGSGAQTLVLPQYPITTVTAVSVDGVPVTYSPGLLTSGFDYDQYCVYLAGYEFTKGLRNVSVSWQAGYSSVPFDIEQACIHLIASRFRERDRIDETSKNIQGMVVSFRITDLPPAVASMLQPYRRVMPV